MSYRLGPDFVELIWRGSILNHFISSSSSCSRERQRSVRWVRSNNLYREKKGGILPLFNSFVGTSEHRLELASLSGLLLAAARSKTLASPASGPRNIFDEGELERFPPSTFDSAQGLFPAKKKKKERAHFYESNAPASLLSVYPQANSSESWRNCFTREFRDSVITSVINPFVSRSATSSGKLSSRLS